MNLHVLAGVLYATYYAAHNGIGASGSPLPTWEELQEPGDGTPKGQGQAEYRAREVAAWEAVAESSQAGEPEPEEEADQPEPETTADEGEESPASEESGEGGDAEDAQDAEDAGNSEDSGDEEDI